MRSHYRHRPYWCPTFNIPKPIKSEPSEPSEGGQGGFHQVGSKPGGQKKSWETVVVRVYRMTGTGIDESDSKELQEENGFRKHWT